MRSRPTEPGAILAARRRTSVLQEVHGLMLAHYAVRRLIHEAARKVDEDPDRIRSSTPCGSCTAVSRTPAFPPSSPNERLRERVLADLEERGHLR